MSFNILKKYISEGDPINPHVLYSLAKDVGYSKAVKILCDYVLNSDEVNPNVLKTLFEDAETPAMPPIRYYRGVTSPTPMVYTDANGQEVVPQSKLPDKPENGDVLVCGQYEYRYNMMIYIEEGGWISYSQAKETFQGLPFTEGIISWLERTEGTWNSLFIDQTASVAKSALSQIGLSKIKTQPFFLGGDGGPLKTINFAIGPNELPPVSTFEATWTVNDFAQIQYINTACFLLTSEERIQHFLLPSSKIVYIDPIAFINSPFQEVEIEKGNSNYYTKNGISYGKYDDNTMAILFVDNTIKNAVLSEGVTNIGLAFSDHTNLISVIIPNGVISIEDFAFSGCSSLTDITIPPSVTNIGSQAFYDCSSLTDITIPPSVTSIGEGAFYGCSSLTDITIPSGITTIEKNTFSGSGLTTITIPAGVTNIGDFAFNWCESLVNITIPDSVTSIGQSVITSTAALKVIYYAGTQTQWNSVTVGPNNEIGLLNHLYFYSESAPTTAGKFWHYVDGIPTVWPAQA